MQATDTLIAQLAAALQKKGIANRTLLVVMGDHGEAFGDHNQLIHGGSVYDEEVHIPFMIENPALLPHEVVVDRVMRELDIAPTLLALLGFSAPAAWQGASAFSRELPPWAYFFAGTGNLTFGLSCCWRRWRMRRGRPKAELVLSEAARKSLESMARRTRSAPQLARRARIILKCAEGSTTRP